MRREAMIRLKSESNPFAPPWITAVRIQAFPVGLLHFDEKLMNERVFRVILIDILAKPMLSFILRRREFCA